jgi:hypothetical protein
MARLPLFCGEMLHGIPLFFFNQRLPTHGETTILYSISQWRFKKLACWFTHRKYEYVFVLKNNDHPIVARLQRTPDPLNTCYVIKRSTENPKKHTKYLLHDHCFTSVASGACEAIDLKGLYQKILVDPAFFIK